MGLSSDQKLQILIELVKSGDGALKAAGELKTLESQTLKTKESLVGFASAFKAALVGIAGAAVIRDSIRAFSEQEQAIAKLNGTLRASGQFTMGYSRDLQDLASSLQRVTKYADETILDVSRQLIAFGAARRDIPKLTEVVLDLASGMGTEVHSAALLMGKAIAGEFSTLSRYGILVDENAQQSVKLAQAIGQVQERFGGLARAEANTLSGSLVVTKNAIDELKEALGQFILIGLDPYVRKLKEAAEAQGFLNSTRPGLTTGINDARRAAIEKELRRQEDAGLISGEQAQMERWKLVAAFRGKPEKVSTMGTEMGVGLLGPLGLLTEPLASIGVGPHKTILKRDTAAEEDALNALRNLLRPDLAPKEPAPRIRSETTAAKPTEKVVKEAAIIHDELERYLERHAANLARLDEQRRASWAAVGQDIKREFEETTLSQTELLELNFERRKQLVQDYYAYEISQAQGDSERIVELENQKTAHIEALNKKHKESLDDLEEGLKKIAQTAVLEFASGMSHAFMSIIDGSKSAGEALKEFGANFLKMVADLIMQLLILRALKSVMMPMGLWPFPAAGGIIAPAKAAAGLITAAGGVPGVEELNSPTYFPRFNVLAGEAGRELMTVLARPYSPNIPGLHAVIGNAGPNRLAMLPANELINLARPHPAAIGGYFDYAPPRSEPRNAAVGGVLSGGISGGVLTGTAVVEIRPAAGFEARIIDSAIKGAEVRVVYDMQHSSPLSEATKRLVS